MSYEDTNCPCGGRKQTETLLCDDCVEAFKDRNEMWSYRDAALPLSWRRQSAIILCALARGRRHRAGQDAYNRAKAAMSTGKSEPFNWHGFTLKVEEVAALPRSERDLYHFSWSPDNTARVTRKGGM
jgi:hypothetical protein